MILPCVPCLKPLSETFTLTLMCPNADRAVRRPLLSFTFQGPLSGPESPHAGPRTHHRSKHATSDPLLCLVFMPRGRLKRSARAMQLFGRLAVLETHTLRF